MLESQELRLRGSLKATLRLVELRGVSVRDEWFEAQTPLGQLRLHLGEAEARKWLDRIEHPPTLAQKLGIVPGTAVHLVGSHPVVEEALRQTGAGIAALAEAQLVFTVIASPEDLRALDRLVPALPTAAQLWVLRQKGKAAAVREGDIMAALRVLGLAPSKTAAWSDDYTADRYGRARERSRS